MEQWDTTVDALAKGAKAAWPVLARTTGAQRDRLLERMADALMEQAGAIQTANAQDLKAGEAAGLTPSLLDRLALTPARLREAADGLRLIGGLPDPLGQVLGGWKRPDGLEIRQVTVPLGVIGIIYEARPNVTVDAAGLCLKSGNAVVLRGGKEAILTNRTLATVLRRALADEGLPPELLQLVGTPDRSELDQMLGLRGDLDLIIPRGGKGLIDHVVRNSQVPVIETGAGVCHLYVEASIEVPVAIAIALNAKTQRPSVCNALETMLVSREAVETHLVPLLRALQDAGVSLRGCPETVKRYPAATPAQESDWETEYMDLILAVKVVEDVDEAIQHIRRYGTRHSEAILTRDLRAARRFQQEVDAACVYVNASTRFSDGGQFGFGAEIGISTQKLHARGPMGLKALTSTKYLVDGDGHVRG
ncbi:MAG: glutamate-5-semialdehyde dehydrogenase [Acidobacteriota bacterium]|nr:glutamate-5-semialdehyde dehydrogenase [Acidobacteriota bacterium]